MDITRLKSLVYRLIHPVAAQMLRCRDNASRLARRSRVVDQLPFDIESDDLCARGSVAGMGYSSNSINNVIFRKSPLCTFNGVQFVAYYDNDNYLVVGKRSLPDGKWVIRRSGFKADTADAHRSASIAVDSKGYLHVVFDSHNTPMKYCRGVKPFSLVLGMPVHVAGKDEGYVTYPELYTLKSGNLLMTYRDGMSGNGNLVVNKYDCDSGTWHRLHDNLIDGEGLRNAYWQLFVDSTGVIHISWVWRETADVASNHDMCYARSCDEGHTWTSSQGSVFNLPLNAENAEYAARIPMGSNLINQTSMCADRSGNPYICSYWDISANKPENNSGDKTGNIRFNVMYLNGNKWHVENIPYEIPDFSLNGVGTKAIPVSRPLILNVGENLVVIFRDSANSGTVSIACRNIDKPGRWRFATLNGFKVGAWEPTFDSSLYLHHGIVSLFVQFCRQGDGEKSITTDKSNIYIIDFKKFLL